MFRLLVRVENLGDLITLFPSRGQRQLSWRAGQWHNGSEPFLQADVPCLPTALSLDSWSLAWEPLFSGKHLRSGSTVAGLLKPGLPLPVLLSPHSHILLSVQLDAYMRDVTRPVTRQAWFSDSAPWCWRLDLYEDFCWEKNPLSWHSFSLNKQVLCLDRPLCRC